MIQLKRVVVEMKIPSSGAMMNNLFNSLSIMKGINVDVLYGIG